MRLVLLGCPGAGKGTQAKVLAQRYGIDHISTGDLFRAEIAAQSPLGAKVEGYLKGGTLVPDTLVVEMVARRIESASKGWILDGFPRTLEQARALDILLKESGPIHGVLALEMSEAEVVRRLGSRRSCSGCGALYNLLTRPPAAEGRCDSCGKDLMTRPDDTEATIRKRLMVYRDLTEPLVAYYRSENIFHQVDGALPVEEVSRALAAIVDGLDGKREGGGR